MTTATGPPLLEREHELQALEALLAAARAERGSLAMVEAPAGQGKTALLRAVRVAARAEHMRVLSATGAELQRDFAFGVVRQLFEGVVDDELLTGAAALAAPIFLVGDGDGQWADASHTRLHGLFWLCANLAERGPLLIVVDDAHWADAPSLRFLDVLARRVEDLPVVLAIGARPAEPGAEQDLLDGLLAIPAAQLFRPAPLSAAAVEHLTAEALGRRPDPAFAAAAAETTGGNALFVRELLRTAVDAGLAGAADEVTAVREAAPATVTRLVAARLRRVGEAARAVANAVAVLGDRTTLARVVELSGLAREAAAGGADELVAAGLLEARRLAFVHPIVREAVRAGLAGSELRSSHASAARLLRDAGAREDEIALHLLATEPEGDPWGAAVLSRAGRRALADGAPDVARRLLARALEEPPAPEDLPETLLALGTAEARTGAPSAIEHLEAARDAGDGSVAARAISMTAYVLTAREQLPRGTRLLRDTLGRDDLPPDLRSRLEDEYLHALWYSEPESEEYVRRVAAGVQEGRAAALAHLATHRAWCGAHRDEVLELLRRALADGTLIQLLGQESYTAYHAIEGLHVVEAAAEADAALEEAEAVIRRAGSPFMLATLSFMRSTWERLFGDLRRAEGQLQEAHDLFRGADARGGYLVSGVNLAHVLLDRGRLAEAEALVVDMPPDESGMGVISLACARARIHAEHGRWNDVLAELEKHYALERPRGHVVWARAFARVLHVRALLALGREEEALALADAEVRLHAGRGALGHEAMARLSRAEVVGGDEALEELREAAALARRSPMRCAEAEVLTELGSRLRRARRPVEAREPLRRARDLGRRVGAAGLEARAHEELVIAGARPQRVALAGVDALTPSERRVADLAAQGRSNRQIAEMLFVTPKTVEVHLGHAYGKLGIKGRSQLQAALLGDQTP